MTRLPIRVRLTLAFAVAAVAIVAVLGVVLYLRMGAALDASIDRSLRSRAADVADLAVTGATGLGESSREPVEDGDVAQVLGVDGSVRDGSDVLGGRPLLSPEEIRRAAGSELVVERSSLDWTDETVRLLAQPVLGADGTVALVVVTGSTTEARGDALESLLAQLLVLGPLLVLLASGAAYLLTGAALRPVETLRLEAEAVSAVEPGRRLPVPDADDELARLARTLNAMLGELEAAIDRERRFVADAGHELRTPIATLQTELELALRAERSTDELRAALASAAEETRRLACLAEELLVLARTAGTPPRRTVLEVGAVLEAARVRAAESFTRAGRELAVSAPADVRLEADPDQLARALDNLLDNALVHGDGSVMLSAVAGDGRVVLHVLDQGPGLEASFAEKAFEPFAQGDRARGGAGSGLGLAIVAGIARAHDGVVGVEGADVWLALPAVRPSPLVRSH